MYRQSLMILIALGLFIQARAQNLPPIQVSVSYFGEYLTHAGIRIGLLTPLKTTLIDPAKTGEIEKSWLVGGFITLYTHQRNHRGLLFTGFIGRQRIGRLGLMTQYGLEAGYMASFLQGEVWTQDPASGDFIEGRRSSSHAVFGLNGGIGWDFSQRTSLPLAISLHPHAYLQAPYNTLFIPRLALESRLSYTLR